MILDLSMPFMNKDDEAMLEAAFKKIESVTDEMSHAIKESEPGEDSSVLIRRFGDAIEGYSALKYGIERRYIDSFKGKPFDDLITDVAKVCDSLVLEDYTELREEYEKSTISKIENNGAKRSFAVFIVGVLRLQLNTAALIYPKVSDLSDFENIILDTAKRLQIDFGKEGLYEFKLYNKKPDEKDSARPTKQKPPSYIIPNGAPVNQYLELQDMLTGIDPDGQITFFPLGHEQNTAPYIARHETKQQPEIMDFVSLTYSGDLDGKAAKITSFDQSVYNGLSSYVQAGFNTFYLDDLIKMVTQKTSVTQQQRDRFLNSMSKFAGTRIRLDLSGEVNASMIVDEDGERIVEGILGGALLVYNTLDTTTASGKKRVVVRIGEEPILYYYSRLRKQIITIPIECLELPCKATDEAICMRDYLLREIKQLKVGKRNNPVINYENLLKRIGKDPSVLPRTEKGRYTAIVYDILNTLRDKQFIKGYEVRTTGTNHKITGFDIKI